VNIGRHSTIDLDGAKTVSLKKGKQKKKTEKTKKKNIFLFGLVIIG